MGKFLLYLVSYLTLTLGFSMCKKYPEDHKLSYETPRQRIETKWILKECLVDNIDITNNEMLFIYAPGYFNDTVIYHLLDATLKFSTNIVKSTTGNKTKVYESLLTIVNLKNNSKMTGINTSGRYAFHDNKKKISFNSNFIVYGGNVNITYADVEFLYNFDNQEWNIKKLTDKEMRLETINSNSQTIKLKFINP